MYHAHTFVCMLVYPQLSASVSVGVHEETDDARDRDKAREKNLKSF